jgi:hypothetical protein
MELVEADPELDIEIDVEKQAMKRRKTWDEPPDAAVGRMTNGPIKRSGHLPKRLSLILPSPSTHQTS